MVLLVVFFAHALGDVASVPAVLQASNFITFVMSFIDLNEFEKSVAVQPVSLRSFQCRWMGMSYGRRIPHDIWGLFVL